MIELKQDKTPFAAHFNSRVSATEPRWLRRIRADAFDRFSALGIPTTHDEDWKYTSVNLIARTPFEPAPAADTELTASLADLGCRTRLVFVNGRFSMRLSSMAAAPPGVTVGTLAEMVAAANPLAESHLARYARFDSHAFVALNTALAVDGAVVAIDQDVSLDEPIQVVYITVPTGRPATTHPRTLILAGRGSQSAVVELYLGPAGETYFTNAVTEIAVSTDARLDHYKLQLEGDQAYHIATIQAVQDRGSLLNSHNVSLGALLARNDVNSILDAEGAECYLNGLFVAGHREHVDNHTLLDHAKPNCASRELYKGILGGHASGVFNGKIIVRKDAQKTNAIQSNRNLLVSGDASINTKPQLEIFADDVRCTHGATVGQLDREALFYMQSRGIPAVEARDLLTHAFAAEVLDRMRWPTAREKLETELRHRLAGLGEEVRK